MSKIDYNIVDDGIAGTVFNDDFRPINVNKVLKDYPYLRDAVNNEHYQIENRFTNIFRELIYENKVVGFITFINEGYDSLTLSNFFVLKEFRDKNLLFEEIDKVYEGGLEVCVLNPSRSFVEDLMECNLAKKITDSIVVSALNFDILPENILKTKRSTSKYLKEGIMVSTNIYELNMCSVVYIDDISSSNTARSIYLSRVLREDVENYEPLKYRKNQEEICEEIKNTFLGNTESIESEIQELKANLSEKEYTIEELFGTDSELSPFLMDCIKQHITTIVDVERIKNQMIDELANNKISPKSLMIRLKFLLTQNENVPEVPFLELNKPICKSCSNPIQTSREYCSNCGYVIDRQYYDNITNEEVEHTNKLIKEVTTGRYSLYDDFDYESEEYLQERKNLQIFTAIKMIFEAIDYDEILDYLNKQDNKFNMDEILKDEEYIKYEFNKKELKKNLKSYPNVILRTMLRSNSAKPSQKKDINIKRLIKVFKEEYEKTGSYSTPKAYKFLMDYQYLDVFVLTLDKFIPSEFEKFEEENSNEEIIEVFQKFLEEHVKHAWETQNFDYYIESLYRLSEIYDIMNEYEKALDVELKRYLIRLNPYMMNKELYNFYIPIEIDNIKRMRYLLNVELDVDLDKKLREVWKELEIEDHEIIVPYDVCYDELSKLKDTLSVEYMREVSDKISMKYFQDK